jgi:hypothetical protein
MSKWEEIVKEAKEHNILIFDTDANGELKWSLFSVVQTTHKQNEKMWADGKIIKWHVHVDDLKSLIYFEDSGYEYNNINGVPWNALMPSEYEEIHQAYIEGAKLPKDTHRLILAELDNGLYVLGAY